MLAFKYRLERVSSSYIYEAEIYKFRIQMASFGACTCKPSYLYSQHACFQDGMLLQPVYARNFARILIPPKNRSSATSPRAELLPNTLDGRRTCGRTLSSV